MIVTTIIREAVKYSKSYLINLYSRITPSRSLHVLRLISWLLERELKLYGFRLKVLIFVTLSVSTCL